MAACAFLAVPLTAPPIPLKGKWESRLATGFVSWTPCAPSVGILVEDNSDECACGMSSELRRTWLAALEEDSGCRHLQGGAMGLSPPKVEAWRRMAAGVSLQEWFSWEHCHRSCLCSHPDIGH